MCAVSGWSGSVHHSGDGGAGELCAGEPIHLPGWLLLRPGQRSQPHLLLSRRRSRLSRLCFSIPAHLPRDSALLCQQGQVSVPTAGCQSSRPSSRERSSAATPPAPRPVPSAASVFALTAPRPSSAAPDPPMPRPLPPKTVPCHSSFFLLVHLLSPVHRESVNGCERG